MDTSRIAVWAVLIAGCGGAPNAALPNDSVAVTESDAGTSAASSSASAAESPDSGVAMQVVVVAEAAAPEAMACAPARCGSECGDLGDGCGGVLHCGACPGSGVTKTADAAPVAVVEAGRPPQPSVTCAGVACVSGEVCGNVDPQGYGQTHQACCMPDCLIHGTQACGGQPDGCGGQCPYVGGVYGAYCAAGAYCDPKSARPTTGGGEVDLQQTCAPCLPSLNAMGPGPYACCSGSWTSGICD